MRWLKSWKMIHFGHWPLYRPGKTSTFKITVNINNFYHIEFKIFYQILIFSSLWDEMAEFSWLFSVLGYAKRWGHAEAKISTSRRHSFNCFGFIVLQQLCNAGYSTFHGRRKVFLGSQCFFLQNSFLRRLSRLFTASPSIQNECTVFKKKTKFSNVNLHLATDTDIGAIAGGCGWSGSAAPNARANIPG